MSGARQQAELERVYRSIGEAVFGFCVERFCGGPARFRMADLIAWVGQRHEIVPDSASRILRELRQRGRIDYRCVNRRASLYEIVALSA